MNTIVITGATDGIGLQTARNLAQHCNQLVVHGRDEKKVTAAITKIAGDSQTADLIPVWGDLSSMPAVLKLAEQILTLDAPIDCLINNAGVFCKHRKITTDGFEKTMAVNYFSAFLLTRKLFPALQSAECPRIVNVSSMTHASASIDPKDLNITQNWSGYEAYATSKLANVLFTMGIANGLMPLRWTDVAKQGPVVAANALHPGVIGTKLLRSAFSLNGISTEEGAKTSVYLATDPSVAKVTGKYFINCKPSKPSKLAFDDALVESIWEASESLLREFL